jgi:endonuclease/exonuclease/phosphatase family metal-dependent hydrolase
MAESELRIVTYNIHKGFSAGNRRFVLHKIREALLTTKADILFLQEMQGEHTKHQQTHHNWPVCSHSEFLAQDDWPHIAYAKNVEYSAGHHGNALLSKYPFVQWENINLSPFTWASRSLLHGSIKRANFDQDLHIICIHLGLMGIERRHQFDMLSKRIAEHVPHDAPLIVAGDFNDWTGQGEKYFAQQLDLQETFRTLHNHYAKSWPAWMPMLTMDRIYYRGLEPISCERPIHKVWKKLSDHTPLIATFSQHS